MSGIIGTDHPLTESQQAVLTALLNTLIPPSDDGRLPGAGNLDLLDFMESALNPDFKTVVQEAIHTLGEEFADTTPDVRAERVSAFNAGHPALFAEIYQQALAVYYRQDEVLRGIGSGEGPPFPRGNDVADGDMTLLDPVIANPKPYRSA